jgi:hypothetical protein
MIKKILKSCLLLSFAVVSIQLSNTNSSEIVGNDLEHLFTLAFASDGESDGGYSCSVTSECWGDSSVSCTGQVCSRGSGWVKCDGNKTEC